MSTDQRIDSEWVALNAFRELLKIATKGQMTRSTYESALQLGGELYPELLGPEVSVLRRVHESDTAKKYRQKASLYSLKEQRTVPPLSLLNKDLLEIEELLSLPAKQRADQGRVDQLKKELAQLKAAKEELSPEPHTENQLIFRDAGPTNRALPELKAGKGFRDFQLSDDNVLRVRVLHPDRPEHITGADIIYERHNPYEKEACVVAVQYKIWENRRLLLTDKRLKKQIKRLEEFVCKNKLCTIDGSHKEYRFPRCAAFLRPTDKLQKADQKFKSTGEHLPICYIDACKTSGRGEAEALEYKNIKGTSLSSEVFEYLFNAEKIGSRTLSYSELTALYTKFEVSASEDHVIIHAQEFNDAWQ